MRRTRRVPAVKTQQGGSVERLYARLQAFSVALLIPALLLVAFSYSFHFAMALGLPPPAAPADLRPLIPALYEAMTVRPYQIIFSVTIACAGGYAILSLAAETLRRYRAADSRAKRLEAMVPNGIAVALLAGYVLLYGWVFSFIIPAVAGTECAKALRLSTGHSTITCGWFQHGEPIYVVFTSDAMRDLRFQHDLMAANRHGLLRRVAESDTELFLIAVPAANEIHGRAAYAPVWRIAKSSVRLTSEALPGTFRAP